VPGAGGGRGLGLDVDAFGSALVHPEECACDETGTRVAEHHFASKYEQPARGEAVGGLSLGQLTGQAVVSGSGGSFRRERRSLA
jgi:hypothetical protein